MRDVEQLLAATEDDAYNALVCTQFAPELGRERVHQPALQDSGHRLAPSREWRDKQVIHLDLHHGRLASLMEGGYAFEIVEVGGTGELPDMAAEGAWPVMAITPRGYMTFFSPEHDIAVVRVDRIIVFKARTAASPSRRRQRRRADGPIMPDIALGTTA